MKIVNFQILILILINIIVLKCFPITKLRFSTDNAQELHLKVNQENKSILDIYFENGKFQGLLDESTSHRIKIEEEVRFDMDARTGDLLKETKRELSEELESVEIYFEEASMGNSRVMEILVDYTENSSRIKMESFSTVKQVPFNDSVALCSFIQSVLGIQMKPCSEISDITSLVHMGLVPKSLRLPLIDERSNFTDTRASDPKQRFLKTRISLEMNEQINGKDSKKLLLKYFDAEKIFKIIDTATEISPVFKEFSIKFNSDNSILIKKIYLVEANSVSVKVLDSKVESLEDPKKIPLVIEIDHQENIEIFDLLSDQHRLKLRDLTPESESQKLVNQISANILDRGIKKDGFHKDLFTSVQLINNKLDSSVPLACSLLIFEHFDQSIFIDKYEVDEIQRFGGPAVNIYQLIDLEKPSLASTQNYISIRYDYIKLYQTSIINFTLPLHFRYQNPSLFSKTRESIIEIPKFYLSCQKASKETLKADNQYQRILNSPLIPIKVELPVGQLSSSSDITLYTTLITILGSLLVVVTIFYQNRKVKSL